MNKFASVILHQQPDGVVEHTASNANHRNSNNTVHNNVQPAGVIATSYRNQRTNFRGNRGRRGRGNWRNNCNSNVL